MGRGLPRPVTGCDHGTHVAGIAAGYFTLTNGVSVSGAAPLANVMSIQAFHRETDAQECAKKQETAPCARSSDASVVGALDWVAVSVGGGNAAISSANVSIGTAFFMDITGDVRVLQP
ncbi:MAG: S8 family serine peptidase [Dehalococcoidia bacterium]